MMMLKKNSHSIPASLQKFMTLGPRESHGNAQPMSYSPGFSSSFITIHRFQLGLQLGWAVYSSNRDTCNMLLLSIE